MAEAAASSTSTVFHSQCVDVSELSDAEVDAATLARFLDCDEPAIRSFLWPGAEKTTLKLSQEEVQDLCNRYVSPGYTPILISSLDGWVACQKPPEGSICVYADALNAGMRIHLHTFCVKVLNHYGLAPGQLAPQAWGYMTAFVLLSREVGVEPSLSAFLLLFSLCSSYEGWYYFKSTPSPPSLSRGTGICIFTGNLPPFPGWESKFFFLKPPPTSPWPCAVDWGKPRRAALRKPELSQQTSETKAVVQQLLDKAGSGIDVLRYLSVLMQRQKHNPVKTEPDVDAAECPPRPLHQQKPTKRKRELFSRKDIQELITTTEKMSQLAGEVLAQLEEKIDEMEKKVQDSHEQLRQELTEATRKHADELRRQKEEHAEEVKTMRAELQRKHDAKVAELTNKLKEHAMEKEMKYAELINKLEEHGMKEIKDDIENMSHGLLFNLDAMFDASLL